MAQLPLNVLRVRHESPAGVGERLAARRGERLLLSAGRSRAAPLQAAEDVPLARLGSVDGGGTDGERVGPRGEVVRAWAAARGREAVEARFEDHVAAAWLLDTHGMRCGTQGQRRI